MSEKWTSRIAVFFIICIIGILVLAVLPDREGNEPQHSTLSNGKSVVVQDISVAEEQESPAPQEVSAGLYYYSALSDEEKIAYSQMYDAIIKREDVVLETVDETFVDKVFQCVMNDHPDIFYCSAYRIEKQIRNTEVIRITFSPNYHMTEDEVQENWKKINAYVQQCISGAAGTLDQYEKVKYVYEYIIRNTKYAPNSDNNQNICSVFIGGESVCQGYAKAAQYILSQMGIEITLAYGNVGGELHSWNLVRVDGEYYYMDPTWGDAGYVRPQGSSSGISGTEAVNYEYFLITTQQLTKTHAIDNVVPLPACVATRNNYYIREGLYFISYDETSLSVLFEQAEATGQKCVTLMCADSDLYLQMKERLITQQEVFRYLKKARSASYSYNDQLYTLIFWIE